jgi:hypothetical protein
MRLSVCIDWLNFTGDRLQSQPVLHDYILNNGSMKPCKAVNGYTDAYEDVLGARVMWHSTRVDMGVHISYSGRTLNAYRDNGIEAREVAEFHNARGHHCTRIDVAIDSVDGALDIAGLWDAIKEKRYTLPFNRKAALVTSTDGITLYIGSRTSDIFLRIYDKGAEQQTDDNWKRVEIELKGQRAMFFINVLVADGAVNVGHTARSVIKAMADFDDRTWQEIVGDTPMTIGKGENREPDTKAWLITQVAPAMGKYIAKHGDMGITEQFLAVVAAFATPEIAVSDK